MSLLEAAQGTPTKRTRMHGKTSSPGLPKTTSTLNMWDPHNDIESVFPDCQGAARIERIFEVFGDPKGEAMDVLWFSPDMQPQVKSDPLNRPLQLATVAEYEQRIFESGLADDCSGPLDG